MDITILTALAAVIFTLIITIVLFFKNRKSPKVEQEIVRPVPNRLRDGAPRRAQMARNRRARMNANAVQQEDDGTGDENDQAEEDANIEFPDNKVGAKKRAKLEAKADKKAQREAVEHMRDEKKKKAELEEELRKKTEEQDKAEEKLRAEEERIAREEKEKREYEEYMKMKEAFSVEEEGYEEGEGDEQNLLQEFVNHIKNQKVVVIEDLASIFKLKTQAAIDRIKDLQNDEILTGVIDDRGKFIYVSPEEMEAVAKFIRQRGRVSIAELAENSNQLINLTSTSVIS